MRYGGVAQGQQANDLKSFKCGFESRSHYHIYAQVAQWQEAIVLGTIQCQFESDLEYHTYALKRGPCPHYIFNMSAHRARIPTKLLPTPDVVYVTRGGMEHSGWQSSK